METPVSYRLRNAAAPVWEACLNLKWYFGHYSSIGKFFMFPLSVISLTVSSIIPLESKESLFWDVFPYFIGIVFLINLLCIILLLKKRKVEKLFWVTFQQKF